VWDGTSYVDGWAVHAGAHEIKNVHRLTASEQALLQSRCEQACIDEWADVAAVAADCTNAGAFTSIELRGIPSIAAEAIVPAGKQRGEGIFGTESLACNVHDECCASFSSNLCPFKPQRVTPGPEPIKPSPREPYVFSLDGSTGTIAGTTATVALDGAVGFSDPFATTGTRPVYLSQLQLSATTQPSVSLSCTDGTNSMQTLTAVELELTQPAFGIRSDTTGLVGFPSGSLLYRFGYSVGAQPMRSMPDSRVGTASAPSCAGTRSYLATVSMPACGRRPTSRTSGCASRSAIPSEKAARRGRRAYPTTAACSRVSPPAAGCRGSRAISSSGAPRATSASTAASTSTAKSPSAAPRCAISRSLRATSCTNARR
jgi:hypothetical protein